MSNCIRFHGISMEHFTHEQIDASALLRALDEKDEISQMIAESYLVRRSSYPQRVNLKVDDMGVWIDFANGTMHTWRSLKATLIYLQRFLKGPRLIKFLLSEESDGFRSRFIREGTLQPSSQEFWWRGEREMQERVSRDVKRQIADPNFRLTVVTHNADGSKDIEVFGQDMKKIK